MVVDLGPDQSHNPVGHSGMALYSINIYNHTMHRKTLSHQQWQFQDFWEDLDLLLPYKLEVVASSALLYKIYPFRPRYIAAQAVLMGK